MEITSHQAPNASTAAVFIFILFKVILHEELTRQGGEDRERKGGKQKGKPSNPTELYPHQMTPIFL